MNGTIKRENYKHFAHETNTTVPAPESCNFSAYSMAAVAGGILLCVGIIIYAILTH